MSLRPSMGIQERSNSIASTSSEESTSDPTRYVFVVKQEIQAHQSQSSTKTITVGFFSQLEDANSKVYGMRLDHETCHPCFFNYAAEINGGCLSWEVPVDSDEDGVKVYIEMVEGYGAETERFVKSSSRAPNRDWRRAVEGMSGVKGKEWGPFSRM